MKLEVTVEPSFVALGPFHIAVGMNDRAWIYEIGEQGLHEGLYCTSSCLTLLAVIISLYLHALTVALSKDTSLTCTEEMEGDPNCSVCQ